MKRYKIDYTIFVMGTNDDSTKPDEYVEIPDGAEIISISFLKNKYDRTGEVAFRVIFAERYKRG